MRHEPAQATCNRLTEMVADHQAGVTRFDDVTVVVVRNTRSGQA
jgi:hypothetical protein